MTEKKLRLYHVKGKIVNEYAVAEFLAGRIGFLDIPRLLSHALSTVQKKEAPSLAEILETEKETVEVLNCLQQ